MALSNKFRKWTDRHASSGDASRHRREASILVDSERLKTSNGFTETMEETFRNGDWQVRDFPFTVSYCAPNPLGDMTGLIVKFDVYMKGVHMWHFVQAVTSIKATEDVRFKSVLDKGATLEIDGKRSSWIPKPPLSEFKVVVRSYEFFIPKGNPLYSDDGVRDAVGLPRVEREETVLDEFEALNAGLAGDLKGYADEIMANIEKMDKIAADDEQMRKRADRFVGKYIPLVNEVLRGYESEPDAALADGPDEIRETLKDMARGSANFLRRLQSKSDMDSEVARTVIEQQLIADGLIDPME